MLVLSRQKGEQIVVNDKIVITVLGWHGGRVSIGIEAPKDVRVVRKEMAEPPIAPPEVDTAPKPEVP